MSVRLIQGFMSSVECAAVRAALDAGRREQAEVLADTARLDQSYRAADYVEVDAAVRRRVAQRLEEARGELVAQFGALGRREGVGFLRYEAGGFYRPHRDRGNVPSWPGAARRAVSVVIFLNGDGDDFEGGQLRLLEPSRTDITPAAGTLVAFRSGCLHEVLPVTRGTRDVIVDWFYAPH